MVTALYGRRCACLLLNFSSSSPIKERAFGAYVGVRLQRRWRKRKGPGAWRQGGSKYLLVTIPTVATDDSSYGHLYLITGNPGSGQGLVALD
ncbi:hypothetical protein BJX61DRAFT_350804 [Aspergillus egyptiacus]|nr:hypothetical protein BJX61DRAFT_350804 [Aspergillus egyptiacus]